ncbi:uncharacterized protein TNCV_1522211 [Trichonephila clavipes]|nr:uncharacterized protein TNCV_1522211 [Trichonephila clavipes]
MFLKLEQALELLNSLDSDESDMETTVLPLDARELTDEDEGNENEVNTEAKREELVDDALIYSKSLCEGFEISFELPRRIRRKHIFGDGSKDVQISYEDDLRRTLCFLLWTE